MFNEPIVIVGLGNPGPKYAQTRHNVGFMLVDSLAKRLGAGEWRHRKDYWYQDVVVGDRRVTLVKPQTFMNKSGLAVVAALGGRPMELTNTVVISDDAEVDFGRWRVRLGGSTGGHNGLKSILEQTGTDQCVRIRVGIGPAPSRRPDIYEGPRELDDYVLAKFDQAEVERLPALIDAISDFVVTSISGDGFAPETITHDINK